MQFLNNLRWKYYRYRYTWLRIQSIFLVIRHMKELTALIAWAQRKRLTRVEDSYRFKHQMLEVKLSGFQMQNRMLVNVVMLFHEFYEQLTATTHHAKGKAAMYRLQVGQPHREWAT